MEFFKKKSNLIMLIVIAVLVLSGLAGAFILSSKSTNDKRTGAIVNEQEADAETIENEPTAVPAETKSPVKESSVTVTPTEVPKVTEKPNVQPTAAPEGTPEAAPEAAPEATPKPTEMPIVTPEQTAIPTTIPKPTETPAPEPIPEKKTCTVSVYCDSVLNHMDQLKPGKEGCIPSGGCILSAKTVEFSDGETVLDALVRACSNAGIQLEYAYTPAYGSYYVEGINNLYEFDCGNSSGWKYKVNGSYPNYGCSDYILSNGDNIVWNYTCSD